MVMVRLMVGVLMMTIVMMMMVMMMVMMLLMMIMVIILGGLVLGLGGIGVGRLVRHRMLQGCWPNHRIVHRPLFLLAVECRPAHGTWSNNIESKWPLSALLRISLA